MKKIIIFFKFYFILISNLAQKLSVAVDEAKSVIVEVIRIMNTEWLLPTYRHVTFIAALKVMVKVLNLLDTKTE